MYEYKWTIYDFVVDKSVNGNLVTKALWSLQLVGDEVDVISNGVMSFNRPENISNITNFNDLKLEQVVEWIKAGMDFKKLTDAMEKAAEDYKKETIVNMKPIWLNQHSIVAKKQIAIPYINEARLEVLDLNLNSNGNCNDCNV